MDGGDHWRRTSPVASHPLPRWTVDAAVGMVARHYAPALLKRLESDPDELNRLQTRAYSEITFGLDVPFLHRADDLPAGLENRYLPNEFTVRRDRYRVTSHWQERHRRRLVSYLTGAPAPLPRPSPFPSAVEHARLAFAEESAPFVVAPGAHRGTAGADGAGDDEALVRGLLAGLAALPPTRGRASDPAVSTAFAAAAAELRALAARTAAELAAALAADARKAGAP